MDMRFGQDSRNKSGKTRMSDLVSNLAKMFKCRGAEKYLEKTLSLQLL